MHAFHIANVTLIVNLFALTPLFAQPLTAVSPVDVTANGQVEDAPNLKRTDMSQANKSGFPTSLVTASPEDGFALAVKLSRLAVKATQPDMETLKKLRPDYADNADSLIAVSQVVAIHFQTIAAANNYWRAQQVSR